MEIKRKKDGSISGISTIGDLVKKENLSKQREEELKKKAELEKKHDKKN